MSELTLPRCELLMEVPFFDTDPMGVTWHGHYVKYFELARCKLLDSINYGYREMDRSGYSWPVVDLRVKYVRPSSFDQQVRVIASMVEYENRLKINYRIEDATTGQVLTKGYSIQVAVDQSTGEMCFVTPELFQQRLRTSNPDSEAPL